jgi:type II secretory pathway component PulC
LVAPEQIQEYNHCSSTFSQWPVSLHGHRLLAVLTVALVLLVFVFEFYRYHWTNEIVLSYANYETVMQKKSTDDQNNVPLLVLLVFEISVYGFADFDDFHPFLTIPLCSLDRTETD